MFPAFHSFLCSIYNLSVSLVHTVPALQHSLSLLFYNTVCISWHQAGRSQEEVNSNTGAQEVETHHGECQLPIVLKNYTDGLVSSVGCLDWLEGQ